MTLKIVGAGFGRTGTLSLKFALEELGFGPCHHMMEVFRKPDTLSLWQDAVRGEAVNWDSLFEGYRSCVDWPSSFFWRELGLKYPDSKILLSHRDPVKWWESANATIFRAMQEAERSEEAFARDHAAMTLEMIRDKTLGGNFDKAPSIAAFNRHIAWVRATVPPERLIVYEPGDGWAPLCEALNVPVPDTEFPKTNSREEFLSRGA